MHELPSSLGSESCENAVASLRQARTDLQLEVQRDMRNTMDELTRNNQRFFAQLQHHYQSKLTCSLTAVERNLGQLLETRKDIDTTRQRIQAFSASSAKISSSSESPAAAAVAGQRQHRVTPHAVREGPEGESVFLVEAAVARSGSVTTTVHNDVRGVMPAKPVNDTAGSGSSDDNMGGAIRILEYDASGNADLGLGFGGITTTESAKRGNATRKRGKQGSDDQQQGSKSQKSKTGTATPSSDSESMEIK